jgi:hypothetical protein
VEALRTAGLSCQKRLGLWEVRGEFVITNRVVVTDEGALLYCVQALRADGRSAVYAGWLGSSETRRWVLELAPASDTPENTRSELRHDSSRTAQPSYPLLMAIRTHLGIESERTRVCASSCSIASRCSWNWSAIA